MVKISIIVPIYNVEKYINKCIDSILAQTFKEFELILVDDGSTDKSGFISDGYVKKDSRVKVIHKQNGGLSSARNKGIENSCGEYLAFIDSDDYIHPKMFEILYTNTILYDSDISMCDYKMVYENKYEIDIIKDYKVKEYTKLEALNDLQGKYGIRFVVAWNKLYRKKLFNILRYEEGRINEDEFIIHNLLYDSDKVIYINAKLYYYLQRENSITKSKFNPQRLDLLDAYIERIYFYKSINERELVHKVEFTYSSAFFIFYYKLKNEVDKPKKYLKKIKKVYISKLKAILRNPYYSKKEKILILTFCINPYIYEKYSNSKTN